MCQAAAMASNQDVMINRLRTNEIEIMFNTKSGTHVKTRQMNKHPQDILYEAIQDQKRKDKEKEQQFIAALELYKIWTFRRDSLVASLPKDVLKLLISKYIFKGKPVKEPG